MGNEGKKRVRKSPEERKKEIIAAASRLIGEKGYYGTSLKDIADAIGMSQPGLLHYIGNKERLLSLLVTDNYDQEGTPADFAKSGLRAAIRKACCFPHTCVFWYVTMRVDVACCSYTWCWKPNLSARAIRCTTISRIVRNTCGNTIPVHMEIAA